MCYFLYFSVNYYNFSTAIAAAVVLAAVALAPPTVNLFPPQGAPQPGNIAAGGGFTPIEALAVRDSMNKYCRLTIKSK